MKTEAIYTTHNYVACDGTGSSAGHPKVYLEIQHAKQAICPYCSQTFLYDENKSNTSQKS